MKNQQRGDDCRGSEEYYAQKCGFDDVNDSETKLCNTRTRHLETMI